MSVAAKPVRDPLQTYQLLRVLDRHGRLRKDRTELDLILFLDTGFGKGRFPLIGKAAGRVVFLENGDLLAGLLHGIQAFLELFFVLVGVLAPNQDLNRNLAALQRLEI